MLSLLTFQQFRNMLQNIIFEFDGYDVLLDDGLSIEGCNYRPFSKQDVENVVCGICDYLGIPVSEIDYWIDDDNDLDIDLFIKRIETVITFNTNPYDRIILSIVYNKHNDSSIVDPTGKNSQRISIVY